ncbi:FtsX-like permease family protein [Dactylosporangium sp. NPDC051484]|uniref:FtsX-like permease family protein n=1 Tax=Dactylosporangium sp. NPDC051484 TaxID=3154942 RepID=UPI00344DEB20
MIGFGLRLAVASGREALVRFVVIAAAVALGVGLLLSTVAGVRALDAQVGRIGWLKPQPAAGAPAADPLVWSTRWDYFGGKTIDRVDVGLTGPHPPVVPGLPRVPAPGEYYVSPALHDLIASHPADELAARFPGREAGIIDDSALASPDSLVAVVGRPADEVAAIPGARRVASISTDAPPIPVAALDLVLSVIAGGLLFPVLIFISTATRLSAARREQRFAAMRLVGATPRQVSTLAAVESTAAAVIGTAAGFALFPALRALMAQFPFTGMRFFPDDLSPGWLAAVLIALGVPLAAALAARLAMRRVRISPLGVARQVTPRPPRAWRLIPLAVGLAELTYFIGRRPPTSNGQVAAFLPGFLVIMVGLVLAGPWITMVGARLMARRARRLPTLVAARRLADNPQAAFRAISGVVLGLFVVSVATGVITTIVDQRGARESPLAAVTMLRHFDRDSDQVPGALLARLRGTPGVTFTLVTRENPDDTPDSPAGVAECAELARIPQYGRCAPGAVVAGVPYGLASVWNRDAEQPGPDMMWPASPVTVEELAALPIQTLVVGLDGTPAAHERVRTVLELAYPDQRVPPATENDFMGNSRTQLNQFQQLANVVMLFSLPIAGCSLAVSVAAGIVDRKRPFSLLRLTGVPLRMLRRVVALESAVPLLAVAVLAAVTGFAAAQLFLRAQLEYTLTPPGWSFYVLTALGLAVSLAIIASTLPLLERVTGPETARNE